MFIECEGGITLNLRYIRSIQRKGTKIFAETDNGAMHAVIGNVDKLRSSLEEIIPANPGFEVLTFWFQDGEQDPINVDIKSKLNRESVIGWRSVDGTCYEPVTAFGVSDIDEGVWSVIDPAGSVIEPVDRLYPSLDHWINDVRERLCIHCRDKATKTVK